MITDKMIAEAAAELNNAMLRSLPEPSECDHQFSPAFERKMKRIVRRANHPWFYRITKSVACFLLVILISLASLMVISPTVRAAVIGWVKEQYETFTTYFFHGDDVAINAEDYELSKIPEGYTLLDRIHIAGSTTIIYVNQNNQILQINYSNDPNMDSLIVVHDSHVHTTVSVGNIGADLYTSIDSSQTNILVWEHGNSVFMISGFLDQNTLILLAKDIMSISK